MNVDSGKRVEIVAGGYTGVAGFVERGNGATLAFAAPGLRLAVGSTVEADGRQWIVERVTTSPYVRNLKLVDLRPKGA